MTATTFGHLLALFWSFIKTDEKNNALFLIMNLFQGGVDGLEAGGREEAIFHDRHRRPEDPRPR